MDKNNHATSRDKKITQPLKTNKNHATIWGKRNNALFWDKNNHATPWKRKKSQATTRDKKKSHNLLGQNKSRNLSGQNKKPATSRDKKIIQPLRTQKNQATSGDKKMTQPLETKQILHPLGHKNYATSRDKKITLSIGPITSQLVHKGPSCSKWYQICPNGSKLIRTFRKGTGPKGTMRS